MPQVCFMNGKMNQQDYPTIHEAGKTNSIVIILSWQLRVPYWLVPINKCVVELV